MIQKQKELSSPINKNAANISNQDDVYEKPNKKDDVDKNGNKRGSSRTDVLPDINQNKRDKSAAGYNNKHSSKSSQDNMIKNFINDNEINKETLNEIDENNNEGFNSTPKMVQGNLKDKKKDQLDQKKKNHNKQQNTKKKEGISALQGNVQISIQGQAAIQNSKEGGSLNVIQNNQGGGINNISNNVNSMSNINNQLNGNNLNSNNNNNNNKGMPQIAKQNNQQTQKDKDFSGLNLKGKNIILPALNSNNNNQSNINNNNNNPSSNSNIPNNNFLKDANAQNRKKR